jgi:serine/threonine protein kinase
MEINLQVLDQGMKGGYGEVFRARIPNSKTALFFEPFGRSVFVIKEIQDTEQESLIHQIIKETGRISTSSLCNINIPWAVLHTKRDGKHVVQICMDDHGKNLDDHIYDYGNRFDPRDIITIIRDVANGLLDLGVPHLDIKPQNILWNKTNNENGNFLFVKYDSLVNDMPSALTKIYEF